MKRRDFITLIGATAAWPLAAHAQQPAMPVIGVLSIGSPEGATPENDAAFERGLAERGYVVGRNVTIERRWARGNYEKLSELAQELVRLNPALIMGGGNVVALAARKATSTIPVIFNIASDPVKLGLATSFAHPGAHISIDVEERESGDIAHAIVTGAADLGLAAEHALPEGIERIPFSEDRL